MNGMYAIRITLPQPRICIGSVSPYMKHGMTTYVHIDAQCCAHTCPASLRAYDVPDVKGNQSPSNTQQQPVCSLHTVSAEAALTRGGTVPQNCSLMFKLHHSACRNVSGPNSMFDSLHVGPLIHIGQQRLSAPLPATYAVAGGHLLPVNRPSCAPGLETSCTRSSMQIHQCRPHTSYSMSLGWLRKGRQAFVA